MEKFYTPFGSVLRETLLLLGETGKEGHCVRVYTLVNSAVGAVTWWVF